MPYYPLSYHALDVAVAFEGILDAWADARAGLLSAFAASVERNVIQTLFALVALHDIGKFAWAFQAKVPELLPRTFRDRGPPHAFRHDRGGAALFEFYVFTTNLKQNPARFLTWQATTIGL